MQRLPPRNGNRIVFTRAPRPNQPRQPVTVTLSPHKQELLFGERTVVRRYIGSLMFSYNVLCIALGRDGRVFFRRIN